MQWFYLTNISFFVLPNPSAFNRYTYTPLGNPVASHSARCLPASTSPFTSVATSCPSRLKILRFTAGRLGSS